MNNSRQESKKAQIYNLLTDASAAARDRVEQL